LEAQTEHLNHMPSKSRNRKADECPLIYDMTCMKYGVMQRLFFVPLVAKKKPTTTYIQTCFAEKL